jgi:hypothetical protein
LLPIIVERLAGVYSDYLPRIQKYSLKDLDEATLAEKEKENEASEISDLKNDIVDLEHESLTKKLTRISTSSSSSSSNSTASS